MSGAKIRIDDMKEEIPMSERKPIQVGVECPDCNFREWVEAPWLPPGPPVGFHRHDNSGWGVNWKCPNCGWIISGRLNVEKDYGDAYTTVGAK